MDAMGKITAKHLSRIGYVYIRQSTSYQVSANTESTLRQYALKDRLAALGWDSALIHTIDADLGISGKTADAREGFQKLMSDVANAMVGAVACIEASRLSRCSADWTRLIEICSMTNTLLIDTDGIYNPNDFNDRLLLGLKGTMSEAELHFLQERMRGGLLNKAKRGELKRYLPIGYEYDLDDRVVKTSNIQIRECIEQFFDLFKTLKTGSAVVKYYAENDMKFPLRIRRRGHGGEILWEPLNSERAIAMLHNPFYTGAYIYGRTQVKWIPGGKRRPVPVAQEDWHVYLPDHHEAYITQREFETNQSIIQENTQQFKGSDKHTAPREGSALLQGICYCGKCGTKMYTQYGYSQVTENLIPKYVCGRQQMDGSDVCFPAIPADNVDTVIAKVVASRLSPKALSLTVDIQNEVNRRKKEHMRYFELQVENARHEEDMARLRYMSVDPMNRLVALELESNWNKKLMELDGARRRHDEESERNTVSAHADLENAVSRIVENFEKIWSSPDLKNENKKRIVRHLIRDVTIKRTENYTAILQICYQGGATEEIKVGVPKPRYKEIETPKEVIEFLQKEAEYYPYKQLTVMLNEQGYSRQCARPFLPKNVHRIMKDYGIKSMKQRYLDRGWLTLQEMANQVGISPPGLAYQVRHGIYTKEVKIVEDRGTMLFAPE
jgi:DNA invertase Pin-like site-specific DNA recombinase